MDRLRHNTRVTALVIYALIVNLAWFAAASAHHVDPATAMCSQSGSGAAVGEHMPQSERHDACHQFCGSHGAAVAAPAIDAPAHIGLDSPHPLVVAAVDVGLIALPWQARGPPLA